MSRPPTLQLDDPRFNGGMIVATTKLHWAMRFLAHSSGIPCAVCVQPVTRYYLDFTPNALTGTVYCLKCWPGCVATFRARGAVCALAEEFLVKTEEYLVNAALTGEPATPGLKW